MFWRLCLLNFVSRVLDLHLFDLTSTYRCFQIPVIEKGKIYCPRQADFTTLVFLSRVEYRFNEQSRCKSNLPTERDV